MQNASFRRKSKELPIASRTTKKAACTSKAPSMLSFLFTTFSLCLCNATLISAWSTSLKFTQLLPCSRRRGGGLAGIRQQQTTISLLTKTADSGCSENNYLNSILRLHRYDRRLINICSSYLPLLVEILDKGQAQVCLLSAIEFCPESDKEPKFRLEMEDGSTRVVDVGQITTIWEETPTGGNWKRFSEESSTRGLKDNPFPLGHMEQSLDGLYRSRVGQARSSSSSLTKKQVSKLVASAPSNQQHVERILRRVIKAGADYGRLVDSSTAMETLFKVNSVGNQKHDSQNPEDDQMKKRAVGAYVLAHDAKMGGRFKRMPCTLVSHFVYDTPKVEKPDVGVSVVNGGWLVLDQSVRAGAEARKFTERSEELTTVADERIAQRLECLAMGQVMGHSTDTESEDRCLELDVRETLKAMGLPLSPQGAKDALLKIGRWSENHDSNNDRIDPWPKRIIEAAGWYADMDRRRRRELYEATLQEKNRASNTEGRVDLTRLPCVCVDAQKATFRDDAVGVRPRSMTGRKVLKKASKWEILVHIADVSDVYSPSNSVLDPSGNLPLLQDAALSRGTSRYDLPLGPLHLMPPTALNALGLETINPDLTDMKRRVSLDRPTANRCVTLWAYIDERTGKLLDAGIERTIISCPMALSFRSATNLLDGSLTTDDPALDKAKSVLRVAERNLKLWNQYHMQRNEVSRARDSRMKVKEMISEQTYQRDKGGKGWSSQDSFQRSRGHRLVDSSLELYGYAVGTLVRKTKSYMPRVSGGGAIRIATGPLRRYVDGMAQRQVLAVLCGYGGNPMTKAECIEAGKAATEAINAVSNIKSVKQGTSTSRDGNTPRNLAAVRTLQAHVKSNNAPLPAMGTGKQNQVAILGIGAIANCRGIEGSLKPGERVLVKVIHMDDRTGTISTELVAT